MFKSTAGDVDDAATVEKEARCGVTVVLGKK